MADFPFIQTYVDYHRESTDAPIKYAKLLGAQLLGHAMGRESVHLIQPEPVHHNLFLVLVGESTRTRKDTSQDLAKRVYPTELSLPQEFTPEQFEKELERQPESIGWLGEFTHFLKQMDRSYMSGIVEIINRLYVNPEEYRRAIRGDSEEGEETIIKNPYIVINSTVTPKMLKKEINPELMLGGFLARWLLVKGNPHRRDRGRLEEKRYDMKKIVKNSITEVRELDKGTFEFTDGALENFNKAEIRLEKNKMALPFAGRYSNYLVKLADILAVSDALGSFVDVGTKKVKTNADSLNELMNDAGFEVSKTISEVNGVSKSVKIPSKYLKRAYKMVGDCLSYAVELTEYTEHTREVSELWAYVKKYAPVGHSEAMRGTGLDADKMRSAERSLREMEKLKLVKVPVKNPGAAKNRTKDVLCTTEKFESEDCQKCEYKEHCFNEEEEDEDVAN